MNANPDRVLANELALELKQFTIGSLARDEKSTDWSNTTEKKHLLKLPDHVLANIFSHVADPNFNPCPDERCGLYLTAKDLKDYRKKVNRMEGDPKREWAEKTRNEYAVRNMLSLRRVCTDFEDVIHNTMIPGVDYKPILVDLKFKAIENGKMHMFKYGGTGANYPCTLLKNITKFNATDDYEHIEKFEKIRNVTFVGIPLTQKLFETILRMDLREAKKVEFHSIPQVQLGEGVNVLEYMENFMNSIDSTAAFYFNSKVFVPDLVLFGQQPPPQRPPVLFLVDHLDDEEAYGRHQEAMAAYNELRKVEGNIDRKYHGRMRGGRKHRKDVGDYRGYRAVNILHTILHASPHRGNPLYPYKTVIGQRHWQKELTERVRQRIETRSAALKKVGMWHLEKLFVMLAQPTVKMGRAIYHLKMLAKITNGEHILSSEEKSIVAHAAEMRYSNDMASKFKFTRVFRGRHRFYTGLRPEPSENQKTRNT